MILHVDESWILEVGERAGYRAPAADGCGVPIAAVARHRGELLEHPVYEIEAGNFPVNPTREQLTALAHELSNPRCTAARIASFLRTWKP
ncbi:fic family toxin-antitoxin system, toxin component [Streptomyces sp. NPDC001852]|uniref:fic family toxin-antitoxin system, toxin component n=1 Tax=Streptomyces sp. NPDC001852 TaxID=3364619 RepID=UPI00368B46AE